MMITLVGLLGLLQAVNVATEQNLRTATRDEAMLIAEETMSMQRAKPFDQISSVPSPYNYSPKSVQSRLRGSSKFYTVNQTVTAISDSSKMIQVQTSWQFKNTTVNQALQTVVSLPPQSP